MKENVSLPIIVAFAISVSLCPIVIPFLHKLKFGQYIRKEGPKKHQKKSGTPTMGGLIILASVVITSLIYVKEYKEIIPILFMTLSFGLIGFLDDYVKVVMKRNLGLTAFQKLVLEIIVTIIFIAYINSTDMDKNIIIPFANGLEADFKELYAPLIFIVVLGTVNGANFTDGLDGLATGVTLIISVFFTVIATVYSSGIAPITGAVIGALMGFFLFNVYPARVFMGDTGSLALGGFVASVAVLLKMPLFLIIVAFVYFIEVLSVIIQVLYFKISGGKRIFKMAPLHHHFELSGWSETRIVALFSIATALLCLIAYRAL
ncbi:MAG: phospho-N-acetylmuramoyl-pentapeptide-transferase [Lachnospiraceae bacterium]|nr:phospho-N-acetylmuramoyl-pentapeptide-transferase [Lachnospiraceae bacterium]